MTQKTGTISSNISGPAGPGAFLSDGLDHGASESARGPATRRPGRSAARPGRDRDDVRLSLNSESLAVSSSEVPPSSTCDDGVTSVLSSMGCFDVPTHYDSDKQSRSR